MVRIAHPYLDLLDIRFLSVLLPKAHRKWRVNNRGRCRAAPHRVTRTGCPGRAPSLPVCLCLALPPSPLCVKPRVWNRACAVPQSEAANQPASGASYILEALQSRNSIRACYGHCDAHLVHAMCLLYGQIDFSTAAPALQRPHGQQRGLLSRLKEPAPNNNIARCCGGCFDDEYWNIIMST